MDNTEQQLLNQTSQNNQIELEIVDSNEFSTFTSTFDINFINSLFSTENMNDGKSNQFYKDLNSDGFLKGVCSSKYGIHHSTLDKRRQVFGSNLVIQKETLTLYDFIIESLKDEMLQILLVASLVSTIIGTIQEGWATGWIEGFSIFLAVLIVVSITSFQNYSKDQQFRQLEKENKKKTLKVKRFKGSGNQKLGALTEINMDDLLVGDVMTLDYGDIAPADGVLISGTVLMDESPITGESELRFKTVNVDKHSNKVNPFIVSGSLTMEGQAEVLVLAVGPNKVAGRCDELTDAKTEDTMLEMKLTDVAEKIGDLGLMAAIFIAVVLVVKDVTVRYSNGEPIIDAYLLNSLMNAFIICITVLVVAIPEGLPMAVTLSLAYSVHKMKDEDNLVRNLAASETMGNVDAICTDKTGTLTTGVMKLRYVYSEKVVHPTEKKVAWSEVTKQLFAEGVLYNSTAYFYNGKPKGNSTEIPLIEFLKANGMYDEATINAMNNNSTASFTSNNETPKIIKKMPFNSNAKYMCTLVKYPNFIRLYVKGAPEKVIPWCTNLLDSSSPSQTTANPNLTPLTTEIQEDIDTTLDDFTNKSMRTLAIAYKDIKVGEDKLLSSAESDSEGETYFNPLLTELSLVSVVGISDAPRAEVKDSISKCKEAGVTVRMVTGDYIKTAIAISLDVGILNENEYNLCLQRVNESDYGNTLSKTNVINALNGNEFEEMTEGYIKLADGADSKGNKTYRYELKNPTKFKSVVTHLKVIARASPEHKFLLVLGLKQLGSIVAVTGDGTNDAPAMRKSDVGFAMGLRGTDIAKNASDIVLLNDSFSSIVTAIKYGRNVYDCIRKFLQFQLTANIVAVFMTLLGGVVLNDSPLNPIQMLWVNLIIDSFASLALATEPPNEDLLKRKPYPRDSDIITPTMKVNIAAQAVFQVIVLTIVIFYGDEIFNVASDRELDHFTWNKKNGYHFTIFFNIFVFLQVFNSINSKKLRRSEANVFEGFFNNYLYLLIQGIIIVSQLVMVTYGGRALRTHPLSIEQHLGCIAIASLCLPFGYLIKQLPIGLEGEVVSFSVLRSRSVRLRSNSRIGSVQRSM